MTRTSYAICTRYGRIVLIANDRKRAIERAEEMLPLFDNCLTVQAITVTTNEVRQTIWNSRIRRVA